VRARRQREGAENDVIEERKSETHELGSEIGNKCKEYARWNGPVPYHVRDDSEFTRIS